MGLVMVVSVVLVACSNKGDEAIQGKWNVATSDETIHSMEITEDTLTIDVLEYDYSQVKSGSSNGYDYYVIKVDGDTLYTVIFPDSTDETVAMMVRIEDAGSPFEGEFVYAMSTEFEPSFAQYQTNFWSSSEE